MTKVTVIGGGAWGTALAVAASRAGNQVSLWAREPEVIEAVNSLHCNTVFLPDITLPDSIKAVASLEKAMDADVILLSTPAQHLRAMCEQLQLIGCSAAIPLVICAKGIEISTGKFMSQVIADLLPEHTILVLTGPVSYTHLTLPTSPKV